MRNQEATLAYNAGAAAAGKRIAELEAEVERLVEALRQADEALDGFPSGVDEEANPDDCSPADAVSHQAGLMRHDLRKALAAAQPKEEK